MTREEAISRIEENKNASFLRRAVKHQNLIRFLTQFAIDQYDIERQRTYFNEFMNDIKVRYNNNDAYVNFMKNITYPLQTNEFIEGIFDELRRVFQANDKYINFSFTDPDTKSDSDEFIKIKWFEEEGFKIYTHSPNTILVTDLPSIQNTELPEPYFYPLFIENVLDIDVDNNTIQSVIFDTVIDGDCSYVLAIDSGEYLLLRRNIKEPNNIKKLEEVITVSHSLGRCPAEWLNNENLYNDNEIVKASIISKSLGSIQNLLKLYTDKTTLDNYILPYITKYKTDGCDYEQGNTYCSEGVLMIKSDSGDDILAIDSESGRPINCPVCNKKLGIAETIKIPTPASKEDYDLAVNAITFKNPDTEIFEYSDKRIKDKEKYIKDNILGQSQELNPNQQQNALRVASNLDGKNQILINFKKPFENSMLIVNNNTLIFRYAEKFLGGVVNLGTQFFRKTIEDLFKEKEEAKKLGVDGIIDYDSQIIDVKYANDPSQLNRSKTILNLSRNIQPYRDKTPESVDKMYEGGKITHEDWVLYNEFLSFVTRFEDDNKKKITEYDFNVLVKDFKNSINTYISEYGKQDLQV